MPIATVKIVINSFFKVAMLYDTHKKFGTNVHHLLTCLVEVATSASQLIRGKREKAMNCSKHGDPLRIFCETCEEVICRDCTDLMNK